MRERRSGWAERGRNALASFRLRLVFLVVLAVVPALSFILYSAREQRLQATAQAEESTLRLVQLAGADHELLIRETRQLLGVLARVPEVVGGDVAACRAFLIELAEQYRPRYTGFAVIERNGESRCVSFPGMIHLDLRDRLYFRRAMETRSFAVGEYAVGRVSGMPILGMADPVLDEAGEVRKVILATLDLRWLNEFAARAALPTGGILTLQDQNTIVLARHPDTEGAVGKPDPETPLRRIVEAGLEGGTAEVVGFDGVERLYAFRRLGAAPGGGHLYLSVGIPTDAVFGPSERTLARNLFLLGIVAILALAAAWVLGDLFFLRHVKALVRATERLQAGDLSARVGLPPGRGELDRLAAGFDRTAAVLEEQDAALRQYAATQSFLASESLQLTESLGYAQTVRRVADLAVPTVADWCVVDVLTNGDHQRGAASVHRDDGREATLLERLSRSCPEDPRPGRGSAAARGGLRVVRVPEDAPLEEIAPASECASALKEVGLRAFTRVPLVARGQVLGEIVALRTSSSGGWSDAERGMILEFAHRAALAVDNARLYETAVEASRVKSDFLAVMSHELRTPLNAIAGYVGLMREGIPVPLPAEQSEPLRRIEASTRHLTELIEEVLTFSRLEAGREEVRLQPTDMGALAREVAALVEPSFRERGLELRVDVPADPVRVETDPLKVRQILLNLLSNAAKFTDHGHVELALRAERARVSVSVSDTGIGIAADELEKVFEPFTQLETGMTRTYAGTGLGLSVSRQLALLLDGELTVASEPGVGSCFELVVPRRAGATPPSPSPPDPGRA